MFRVALVLFAPVFFGAMLGQPAAAAPLAAYGALPAVELVAVSPDGGHIAIVGVIGNTRALLVVDRNEKQVMGAPIGDIKVRDLNFADDRHVLVTLSKTEKLYGFTRDLFEAHQVLVADITTKKMLFVFDHKQQAFGGVFDYFGTASVKGQSSGFFSTVTMKTDKGSDQYHWEDEFPDLYRVDLDSGAIRLLSEAHQPRSWLVDATGTPRVALDVREDTGGWRLINLVTNHDIAKGTDPEGDVALWSFGRTPDTIVLKTRIDATSSRLNEINVQTGESTEILGDESVNSILTDSTTGLLIGYSVDGDNPDVRFFDKTRAARMRAVIKAFPGERVTLITADANFETVVVYTDGPKDSGTWWHVDIRTGAAIELGRSYPKVDDDDVGAVQMIDYVAGDGLKLRGVLTLPPGRKPEQLPLIVLPHGGPEARDYPQFDWWAQALASRGYAVFQPNFRGSTGYGGDFHAAGFGQWGAKMQTDISDGVAALAARGFIDPKRACIVGASYGGYAALAGVTLQHGFYRCAVSVAGVADLAALLSYRTDGETHGTAARGWLELIGPRANLGAISPVNSAAKADAPILLIHGRDDTVVPYKQSERMLAALRGARKPVELVTLAGEDHWLSRSETRTAMLEAAVAFVEKNNPTK
jgi:dipeptidyl aminopeptidase/acylaminoacyl peptidase